MNIVLHQPEIPHNTGAIGRTCLLTGAKLHLIHPFGFYLDNAALKRSGMDYWHRLDVCEYADFDDFLNKNKGGRLWLAETGGSTRYDAASFEPSDYIIFGSEATGLPKSLVDAYRDRVISIPMVKDVPDRSLNLSVCVAIILYEALRQTNFWMGA